MGGLRPCAERFGGLRQGMQAEGTVWIYRGKDLQHWTLWGWIAAAMTDQVQKLG
jgi:hypothetical protein